MLVTVTISGVLKDAHGVVLARRNIKINPVAVFGDDGTLVPTHEVSEMTSDAGLYSISLYTLDTALAYVRYTAEIDGDTVTFDLTDDLPTTSLDALINAYTGAQSASAAAAISALQSPNVREIVLAADTITQSDLNDIIRANRATALTLTITGPIAAGFNCLIRQVGAGQVTFAVAGGASLVHRQGHTKTAGQHAIVSLICDASNVVALAGDTA